MDTIQIQDLRFDEQGLIPAVVTESHTNTLLMLAYMTKESLLQSITLQEVVFYSRSRKALWHKGKTSGNILSIESIHVNCYNNSLHIMVTIQGSGVACHTNNKSCFFYPT